MPIAPVPTTSARRGPHGWRPPIARTWRSARSQTDAGSASTPSRPSVAGTGTRCSGASATSSAANPCSRVIPRSR